MATSNRKTAPRALEGASHFDPDYLLGALHRQLEQATGFAKMCRHVAPELEQATEELVASETALYEATSALVLRHALGETGRSTQ
ncbi:hypothetical protein ACVW00_000057 [Marmoricola sp. URHA0025 HA25]